MNDAECNGLVISIYFLMVLSADSPLRSVGIVETGIARGKETIFDHKAWTNRLGRLEKSVNKKNKK